MATQTKTTRAGKVGVTPKGDWSATYNNSQGYDLLDEVQHNHDSWVSKVDANRDEPTASSAKWFRSTNGGQYAYEQGQAASVVATETSRVNISLSGMTLTITDRNGQQTSQNVGFEIYRTYASETDMNADAANVPSGKFVIIATTDRTSEENARLYCRNERAAGSAAPFSLMSDLDQAASAAWADWLENMKPLIQADHTQAGQNHQIAVSDHQQATTDHDQAVNDHSTADDDHMRAELDHTAATDASGLANAKAALADEKATLANQKAEYAQQQGDYAKRRGDYPDEIRSDGYIYTYDPDDTQADEDGYVRTDHRVVAGLDLSALTAAQRQELIDELKDDLVFASVSTCESIIDELV